MTRMNNSVFPPGLPTRCLGRKVPGVDWAHSMLFVLMMSRARKGSTNSPVATASRISRIKRRSFMLGMRCFSIVSHGPEFLFPTVCRSGAPSHRQAFRSEGTLASASFSEQGHLALDLIRARVPTDCVMAGGQCLALLQQLPPVVAHVVDLVADRADGVGAGMEWLRQLQESLGWSVGVEPVVEAPGVDKVLATRW